MKKTRPYLWRVFASLFKNICIRTFCHIGFNLKKSTSKRNPFIPKICFLLLKNEEQATSKLGSRTNPVPFQKTATVDDELYNDQGDAFPIKFDLTVEEVTRGDAAYQKLKAMNEFNEPAPQGYEWMLVKAKVKLVKSETQDLSFNIDGIMNFKMVSESGDIYSGDIYGTTEPAFSFEMYVGNEKEGYIADLVKTGEKAQLRYEEMIGGQVFFNLQ